MRALIACILIGYCVVQLVVSADGGIDAIEQSAKERQQYLTTFTVVD